MGFSVDAQPQTDIEAVICFEDFLELISTSRLDLWT